ncbi:MAG: hypothetical protein AAFR61_15575 [Bacteroidota bacterium]
MMAYRKNLAMWSLLSCLFAVTFFTQSCSKENKKTETIVEEKPVIPREQMKPAVPNDPKFVQKPSERKELTEVGMPISIDLPEDVQAEAIDGQSNWMLTNESGTFSMMAEASGKSMTEHLAYWKGNPDEYTFQSTLTETSYGAIIEVSKGEQLEYHVDCVIEKDKGYHLYSNRDNVFSAQQAAMMFHACRTAHRYLNLPEETRR